jgi:hypothetical protein
MKMTKIAFWRNILEVCLKSDKKESKYQCYAFISGACDCHDDCVPKINDMMCELATNTDHRCKSEVIKYAEKQIKRHEQKCKKKDHILDTTKKVEEPKPIKTVGIDNSDVTLALTPQHDHIVDKHEMVEPKPISFEDPVPEYVYWLEENCIIRKRVVEFVQKRYKSGRSDTFALVEGGENPYLKNLYRTLEEAVMVAKKLWNGEGK